MVGWLSRSQSYPVDMSLRVVPEQVRQEYENSGQMKYVFSSKVLMSNDQNLQIVNYDTSPLHLQLVAQYSSAPFDLIIDSTGIDPNIYPSSPSYLKPEGAFIQPGGSFDDGILITAWRIFYNTYWPAWAGGVPRAYKMFGVMVGDTESIENELKTLVKWVEEGKLRVDVDSVYGFDREGCMSAYARIMTGKARGKVVVRVS